MTLWQRYLVGLAVMVTAMTLAWLWQKRRTNAGIVDVVWSFGTGAMCALLAMGGSAPLGRRLLISGLAAVWACRLGVHLFRRVTAESEDGRYQAMRASFGAKAQIGFFAFFQIQAVWTLMFATPLYFAAGSPAAFPQWFDLAGVLMWLLSVGGEALADAQLAKFRNDHSNKGKVCNTGLWRYSRHPNYFFEWLHWFTYVLIGVGSPYWWATLFGPVVMGVFLYKVTGIPFTEKRAIQSRGEAYRQYQATTSAFIPWPPKQPKVSV